MDACQLGPLPRAPIRLICAGQSEAGLAFTAKHADYNFCFSKGINTPAACAPTMARMQEAAARTGRPVASYPLFMIITGESDGEAMAKWEHYKAGADLEALAWLAAQGAADARPDAHASMMMDPDRAVNLNMGTLIGSYASIAAMLDEASAIPGLAGAMLVFDEFITGTQVFGERIQPLMQSRRHVPVAPSTRESMDA